jgi:hypothetical protein
VPGLKTALEDLVKHGTRSVRSMHFPAAHLAPAELRELAFDPIPNQPGAGWFATTFKTLLFSHYCNPLQQQRSNAETVQYKIRRG